MCCSPLPRLTPHRLPQIGACIWKSGHPLLPPRGRSTRYKTFAISFEETRVARLWTNPQVLQGPGCFSVLAAIGVGWVCCDLYGRQPGQQSWVFQSHYLRYVHVLVSLLFVGPLFITYLQSASPHPWNKTFTLSMDSAYHRESISPMCTSVKHAW